MPEVGDPWLKGQTKEAADQIWSLGPEVLATVLSTRYTHFAHCILYSSEPAGSLNDPNPLPWTLTFNLLLLTFRERDLNQYLMNYLTYLMRTSFNLSILALVFLFINQFLKFTFITINVRPPL